MPEGRHAHPEDGAVAPRAAGDAVQAGGDGVEEHGRLVLDTAVVGDARLVRHLMEAVRDRAPGGVVDARARGGRPDVDGDHHAPLL